MSAGEDFVKKIRPVGCVFFIALAVLVAILCLTSGRDPIKGYEAPEDAAYYAEHLDELRAELESNVFPSLEGVDGCEITDSVLTVSIEKRSFAVTRAAILRYFDKSLFEFVEN